MPTTTMFYLSVGEPHKNKNDMSVKDEADPIQKNVETDQLKEMAATKSVLGTFEELTALMSANKCKEAKLFVRDNNWPLRHPVRSRLWEELCRRQVQDNIVVESYYWDTVKQMSDVDSRFHLPSFVDPAHTMSYHLTTAGRQQADRIISVVAFSYPAITFSPTIYSITCLLLHYMSEEACYDCLCALLSWKQGKFIIQTKLMYETSWRTVLHLTKKFAKVAYGNINKYLRGTETTEQVFELWLWWIFKHLPFSYLIRVMDCFLFEGSKVLYRTAMAILILFQKHTAKVDSKWAREASVYGTSATIAKFCEDIPVTPEKLLKVAFSIRALSQSEVNRILVRTEMYLKSRRSSNTPTNGMTKSRSTEGIPTSQSQLNIQMASHTLNIHELLVLWSWLPARITMYQPQLLYTTDEHGCSLTTFYSRVDEWEPTVLVIKTTTDEILGAYCSNKWAQRKVKDECGQKYTYFGTGETFIFTIAPKCKKYSWVGIHQNSGSSSLKHAEELFMAGDATMLTIGGGSGQAILLDEDIRFGRTESCQTFSNQPLCASNDFECKVVEVFGFS